MAVQTYASISALLPPRISPRRTTVTRLFSVSATASSPSASLSRSTPPRIARPRVVTQPAKRSHAAPSSARQRSSRACNSPGITRIGPDISDTGWSRSFPIGMRRRAAPSSGSVRVKEGTMATRDEVARQPLEQRRARLALAADDLAAGIHAQSEAVLARRPAGTSWAAKEIVCHLRDTEEMFLLRLEAI